MIALSAIVLTIVVGAPTPATSPPTPTARLAELVAKLGDKSYRAREDAARQLLLQGTAAVGVLTEGTKHDDPERYLSLKLQHGFPSVYYQFLANVCHKGFQDRIIPFPQTAATAALWFRYHGIAADMVYLDASHEEEDVYQDLCNYWEILSADGGDPAVHHS